jgi:hypothetical protein
LSDEDFVQWASKVKRGDVKPIYEVEEALTAKGALIVVRYTRYLLVLFVNE